MTQRYAIGSLDEAKAYLDHPLLGLRYRECLSGLPTLPGRDDNEVFGPVHALKLRSSLTLFARASGESLSEAAVNERFGSFDPETMRLLDEHRPSKGAAYQSRLTFASRAINPGDDQAVTRP